MYQDRTEAGLTLAKALKKYKKEPGVILAVPRGGIPVAYVVAKELQIPIDLVLTKKIGHPLNKEYAIGAVSMADHFVIPHENVSEEYVNREIETIRSRLKEMYAKFMGDHEPTSIKDKIVIVIDDGIATGNTLLATIRMLRRQDPAKIVIAVPVASKNAIEKLGKEADEIICPLVPDYFTGVGAYYEDFDQVSDREAMYYLDLLRKELTQTRA